MERRALDGEGEHGVPTRNEARQAAEARVRELEAALAGRPA
jgi:hypothetical protein